MDIKRAGSQPSAKGPTDWFTGTVRIDSLFQAHGPHDTRIRSARPSSSRLDVAACNAGADPSTKSGRAMWSGPRLARSTGMGLRRPPR